MADVAPDIAQKIRRKLGDRPVKTRSVNPFNATTDATITLPAGHIAKFPKSGVTIEWDDDTGERDLVDSVNADAGTITVIRAQDDTAKAAHLAGATILIEPRFSWDALIDTINECILSDLWPHVWVFRELALTEHAASDLYVPGEDADPVEELVYAYQLQSGRKYPLHAEFLGPDLVDTTNFPNGVVQVSRPATTGSIYVAYRAKPTNNNLTEELKNLVVWGAAGDLLTIEEAMHVGPDRSLVDSRVADASKLRAGAVFRQRMEQKRDSVRVSLLAEESLGSSFVRT